MQPVSAVQRLVAAMPKAELHLHLDGSVRVETALDLARTRDRDAPRSYEGMFTALTGSPSRTMSCSPSLGALRRGSQAKLLELFELPIRLLQDAKALERVTFELVEDKARDRVLYLEIRWAPQLHVREGLSLTEAIEAVVSGAERGSQLTGSVVRLVAVGMRSDSASTNVKVVEAAAAYRHRGLVAFDLAGLEAEFPDPLEHRVAFDAARAAGLEVTVHAGEIRDGGATVRKALELGPRRIAHGLSAAADHQLIEELARLGVTLDMCPTSNVHAGAVRSIAKHPLPELYRQGVSVTISTDDTTISDVTLTEEYTQACAALGIGLPDLWAINRHALDVAFGDITLNPLEEEFDRWASKIPELRAVPA